MDEDVLSARFLPKAKNPHVRIGRHIACFAGKVTDPSLLQSSSSGGMGRWLLRRLLETQAIDQALVVSPCPRTPEGLLYRFEMISTPNQVMGMAKSAYHPVEMSEVLQHVMKTQGRYAISGVPCFIKALRNLMVVNPELQARIRFTLGIVCGHLKSTFYGEMIGWQLGVPPDQLGSIDFRVKIPGKQANEKGVSAIALDSETPATPPKTVRQLFGTDYGQGLFKPKACDYCDDVLAETADISIGDAWLPQYLNEGNSLIITRHPDLHSLIEEGMRQGDLQLDSITADQAADSQDAGLRHRREGLAYRLALAQDRGDWVPTKRVKPSTSGLTLQKKMIFRIRMKISRKSFPAFIEAKRDGDWNIFQRRMNSIIFLYTLFGGNFWKRLRKKIRKHLSIC
ncbi:MAG: Coenzyme F420 hydrogenase/dehydrogenase, beta subunit C-terminal domain [Verrucomicrobia bacterium]|nr:Coenzyme F420 hydrogenase/dehydrogenase, beta subunit C-terminal domain [Verrucomicrobiota bacterium]MCH8511792.1 Coenzyme F420 hydrogenase/dehydrogenase, beta subunit C-terminal domain [Kiritimatiellia bacterium]